MAAQQKEMSFLDHLEELRWHLIRAVGALFLFTMIAFIAEDIVFKTIIFGPSRIDFITYKVLCQVSEYLGLDALCIQKLPFTIQSRTLTGQFTMHVLGSVVVGLVCAFPYAFWEVWRFVKPGLYQHEQKVTQGATFFVSLLFLIGVAFGYFVLSPLAINFLSNYQIDPSIANEFDITSYVSTLATLVLACGLMFQLPMVVYFLSKVGILTPSFMRNYRRHSVVVIFIIAAVITPPDPFSQVLVAMPITLLYEVSIFISARVEKNRLKQLQKTN
jgi:sec-independent protein translocase protein TatC